MRTTSKKLLLWLYHPHQQRVGHWQDVPWLLPELTAGGRRSLIAHLQNQHYLVVENVVGETTLRLTDHGQRSVEAEFPALSPVLQQWDGVWAMMAFLNAPTTDLRFRNLRKLLMEQGAGQLTRGVYLYPGEFPQALLDVCGQLYRGHIVITSVNGWQFGDERSIVNDIFLLSDALETYSGISREIKQLLDNKKINSELNHSQKQHLFTVFNRFATHLSTDLGIATYYFPQVSSPLNLLTDLQALSLS